MIGANAEKTIRGHGRNDGRANPYGRGPIPQRGIAGWIRGASQPKPNES